ncbi:hypothetical protein BS47DRAFT_1280945, partial [Hydnum rufescens UP504]
LNPAQFRAFDIIISHLTAMQAKEEPEQLLMQLTGEGGTGKSKVIQSVTLEFTKQNVSDMLAKGAYTGIAACVIGGQTLHTLCGL